MLSSQLAGQPFHRILEPATTCSVFARPSFAQHLLCHSPHPTIQPSPLSVYYLLYPAQAGRASVAPDLGILFAWQSRGRVKRGRVHCIASTQPATPRIAKREGGAASVQCKMQSSIAESSWAHGIAKRGERGAGAVVTYIQPFCAMQCTWWRWKGGPGWPGCNWDGVQQEEPASLLQVERKWNWAQVHNMGKRRCILACRH